MSLLLMIAAATLGFCALAVLAWRRVRRRRTPPDDVICLGYDDQDNVNSMRSTMLDRLSRADLDV